MSDGGSRVARVHAAAQAAVGRTSRVVIGEISARDMARYGVAVSGSVVDGADVGEAVAPLYLTSVLAWGDGPAERDLLADGNAADPFAGVSVDGLRMMGGGQDLVLHRDVEPGSRVVIEVSIADVSLRETRSGLLLVIVVERRCSDDRGLLLECRETFLGREEAA